MANKLNKGRIDRILKKHKRDIKGLGVERISLFGSFLEGVQKGRSDVDFLVRFRKGKHTFDNYFDLRFLLEHLLKRKIDLITEKSLKPALRNVRRRTIL